MNFRTSLVNKSNYAKSITMTDYDGNVYPTVKIGNQVWTASNLRTTNFNNGSPIFYVTNNTLWSTTITPGYCYYDNIVDVVTQEKYGALYNWYVISSGKLAPKGWHVPTSAEWKELENYLIANRYNYDRTTTGNKIGKSLASKTDWSLSEDIGCGGNNIATNNSSGFSALPTGYRNSKGFYNFLNIHCYWWGSTGYIVNNSVHGYYVFYDLANTVTSDSVNTRVLFSAKRTGGSVRLVKD